MEARYHIQNQARDFARKILPVPISFPLAQGVWDGFPRAFSRFADIMRSIFLDMAERPADYGLTLVPIDVSDGNLIRDGYRTIHRLADTLYALCVSGAVEGGMLTVNRAEFAKNAKKISKTGVIIERLGDFGLVFAGFSGKSDEFTIEYPDESEVLRAMYDYFMCWKRVSADKSRIKIRPKEFHHHYYAFDYKIASDMDAIPTEQWIDDEATYFGLDEPKTRIWRGLHEQLAPLPGVKFDGEYHYKGRRIVRPFTESHDCLTLKLSRMDAYPHIMQSLPDSIKAPFTRDSCAVCGFQGATEEHCKFRLRWTLEGQAHKGCVHMCFRFKNPEPAHLETYVNMIKAEYGF